jgi:hypothetical protein
LKSGSINIGLTLRSMARRRMRCMMKSYRRVNARPPLYYLCDPGSCPTTGSPPRHCIRHADLQSSGGASYRQYPATVYTDRY